jgi:hypothetical protein
MERTHRSVHWRNVAAFVATGALLTLMGWAFLNGHRWLTYLGLLGWLGVIHAFPGMGRLHRFFGSTTTRVRVHRSGQASRSRSIQIHQ